MKRQGSSSSNQPPVKKSDASTDLRSKIGAKLQTLLNGIDTDSVLYARRRKQLYADLFGKPKYSEIIIDPTIVIKEEPADEECNNDSSTLLNSQNFLLTAKSRLTELLNKQQDGANKYKDSGKENTLFANRNKSSSSKSSTLQNPSCSKSPSRSCNALNRKRISANKECANSSDSTNHGVHLKKLVVVLEDCMKSNYRTKLLPSKHPVCNRNSPNLRPNYISKKDELLAPLDNLVNKKNNNITSLCSDKSSKSHIIPENSKIFRSKSLSPGVSNNSSSSKGIEYAEVFPNTEECVDQIPHYNEDESEMIDDPLIPQVIVDIKIGESISIGENSDSEVELLCVKQPTAEVITLEDNEEEVVKGTEVSACKKDKAAGIAKVGRLIHKCKQCGKSFRAASLLNFHIRMHGNSLSQSPSSSSHSVS